MNTSTLSTYTAVLTAAPAATPVNISCVAPLQETAPFSSELRHQLRQKLRHALRDGPSEDTSALILLLNWLRGLPGTRGFSPLKRVGPNGNDHGHRTLLELIMSASPGKHLAALLDGEPEEERARLLQDFRLWALTIARTLWVDRFNALAAGTPGLKGLLEKAAMATPHGPSDALAHGSQARSYWYAILVHLRKVVHGDNARTSGRFMTPEHIASVMLPSWASTPAQAAWLLNAIEKHPLSVIENYLRMHDCGKAFCMTLGDNGKPHYPDHAQVSARVWLKAGGLAIVAELMAKDMLVHTISAADCESFAADPLAPVLLIAALAEIHANAVPIFGGFDSDSFKIKFKQIERRGSALLKRWVA